MEDESPTMEDHEAKTMSVHAQDLATILSQLPRSGAEDDVSRLMDIYESVERRYRATVQASSPTVRSSASTSL